MLLIERGVVSKKKNGVPTGYNIHHRKPRRLGGLTTEENTSVVLRTEHEAWNILFDNLPALEVVKLFKDYWEMFGDGSQPDLVHEIRRLSLAVLLEIESFHKYMSFLEEVELNRVKKMLATQRTRIKKERAWRLMFGGLSLEEIVAKINNVWLDPDYRLVVEIAPTANIKIAAR